MSDQLRAGHFFSSLNGNLPGDDYSNLFLRGNPVFSTNPRGAAGRFNQHHWDPLNLTMEEVQWDKSTYILPVVLPPTATSELRSRVLALTLKTLTRSTRGDYATKAALLKQRFQCASAATRARTKANPAKNILGGAYTFHDPLVKRATGTVLNVNDPPTDNDRANGKFLEFRATFRPLLIDPLLESNTQSFVTAVRLPVTDNDNVLQELEDKDHWYDATRVMTTIYSTTAALPELLELGDLQNGRLQINELSVANKMAGFYDKIYFDLLKREIGKDYVGDAIQNAQSVVQNTKQVRFVAGRQICDPIEVYLKRFSSAVDLLDEDKPYPIDIVSTCHQNMSEIWRKQIRTLGWTEPPKAGTNAGQHTQFSALRAVAIRAEEAITTTRLIAATKKTPSYQNTAFPTVPIFTATTEAEEEEHTVLPPLPEIQLQRPPGPPPDNMDNTVASGISTMAADRTLLPTAPIFGTQPVPNATLMEEAREFQIFMSNSEIAMRTAAGEEDKLCWGGCYKFFPNDSDGKHTYSACPFRRVDRVREHALPYLRRFRQQNGPLNRRVSSLLADPDRLTAAFCQPHSSRGGISRQELDELQNNWQEKGFASAEMARSICLMANPTTSKATREAEANAMKNKIARALSNKRRREQDKADLRSLRSQQTSVVTTQTDVGAGRGNTSGTSPTANNGPFVLVTLPIFSTGVEGHGAGETRQNTVNVPSSLRMSQALPHIDIPVGMDIKSNQSLRVVFDSGAGLNVGRRSYHEGIRQNYPHLISHYIDLEANNFDTPSIGGVDGNAYGTAVTALLTYRTPFLVHGQPVELAFGLVDGLCAKSIIGITTMQKAKMNYLVHSQVVTSETFNHTFAVTMQKPMIEDAPPAPITGNAAVLNAQANTA